MTINASAFFDPDLGYYRVRFWSGPLAFDTTRKVKETFWSELGVNPPPKAPAPKFDKLAQRWAEREADAIERGLRAMPRPPKKNLAQVWQTFREQNPNDVSAATIAAYSAHADRLAEFFREQRRASILPEEIDIAWATKYRNWRRENGAAPRTIKNELVYLKGQCEFALAWQSDTGCESLRLQKLPAVVGENVTEQIALTEEEFGTLLGVASDRDRRILVTGVTTMLRKANLLGFRGEWLDRDERMLRIPGEYMKGRRGHKHPLTAPVSSWTLEQIEAKEGFAWPSRKHGQPLYWFEDSLERLITASAVREFSLHDLRTTGTSWLDNAGVDKLARKVLLNHATHGDVTDLYTKKYLPLLREAVGVFDAIRERRQW